MSSLPDGVRRAFRLALRRPRIEQEVDDEVAFHLDMRIAELVANGHTPDDARAEALRRFGDTTHWSAIMSATDHERVASERRSEWMDDLRQDVRYALRSFRRSPLFSLLAVLTLALGIGANAAVFGVVKSVLLDALPYRDADRVVRIYGRMRDGSNERMPTSAGAVNDMRERVRSLTTVSAIIGEPANGVATPGDEPTLVKIARAEPSMFAALGTTPALGRVLHDTDAQSDTAFSVVITHRAWQRLFGGSPDVIGRTIPVNGISRTVVGVLPNRFVGPVGDVDFYMPFRIQGMLRTVENARLRQNFAVVARLADGATMEGAKREVDALADEISSTYPRENGNITLSLLSVRDAMVGETRTPLLVLMASAGLVLLITCANLAGALLTRTITRRKEFAIRAALGAGRGRLVRQLLTESTLLSIAGGALGVALAAGGLVLVREFAAHALPAYASLTLDTGAFIVTGLIAVATGVAFGAAPAFSVARTDPQAGLREESRSASESVRSRRLRGVLVAGQIALCVSLLAGAGLLARSLWAMTQKPLGFDDTNVLSVSVHLLPQRYPNGDARRQFMQQFDERLRAVPGVVDVSSASEIPTRIVSRNGFSVVGAPPVAADAQPLALYMDVSDSYFRAMRIPIREGRSFNAEEIANGPLSVIINESMARQYFPRGDALGARLHLGPPAPNAPVFTIVGIVGDVRNDPARVDAEQVLYLSNKQFPWNGPMFLIRTSVTPSSLVAPIRQTLSALDPTLPLHNAVTMEDVVSDGFAPRRLPVVLMTAFGVLALLLASVGVYAMFAAMATAREREFAVRMALGSSRGAIAQLVLRQGALWMGIGLVAGFAGVIAISRAVRSLLYGVQPYDPLTFIASTLLLLVCGAIALMVPVRRATSVYPNSILR